MDIVVTNKDIETACVWIGKKLLHWNSNDNPKQILVLSDLSSIDKFDEHPLNRTTDPDWVSKMTIQMLNLATKNEATTLEIAINKNDIRAYATAMSDGETYEYKVIILDGQHRWKAMREIKNTMPHIKMDIILHVHVCEDEDDIVNHLNAINNRRAFTDVHSEQVAMVSRFFKAVDNIVTPSNRTRRCVTKLKNSNKILKSAEFNNKFKNYSVADFEQAIKKNAESYKAKWDEYVNADIKHSKTALYQVVYGTKLYNLVDDSYEWLMKLKK